MTLGPAVPWLEPQWFPAASGTSRTATVVAKAPRACVRLRLPGRIEDLSLKRNVRESVRRARNRLNKSERPWTVRTVTDPSGIAAAFATLSSLHAARAALPGKVAHHDALAGDGAQFVRDAIVDMAGRGRARIYELCSDGEVIAALLVLTTSTSSYLSVSGMTEEAWQYSPMALLIHVVAQDTIARGATDLYLSVGPDEAKLRWSEEIEYYPQFVVVPPTRSARRGFSLYLPASSLARYRRELSLHTRRPGA
jgi:CelD/BcsL family acetyltransferase involved in cellulose biosynthesis